VRDTVVRFSAETGEMRFLVYLRLGPLRFHPYRIFEGLTYLVGFRLFKAKKSGGGPLTHGVVVPLLSSPTQVDRRRRLRMARRLSAPARAPGAPHPDRLGVLPFPWALIAPRGL